MPVPRRRHCPSRRKRGRTHKKLSAIQCFVDCVSCGNPRLPHQVCPSCGEFQGRKYGKDKTAQAE